MSALRRFTTRKLGLACLLFLATAVLPGVLGAQSEQNINITVMVRDAQTDQPIDQAHLTLQFQIAANPAKLQRSRQLAYSAKTDRQGRCRFTHIPKGTIRLLVTADKHQAFGKEFDVNQENQVIEVKLRKPQPLL